MKISAEKLQEIIESRGRCAGGADAARAVSDVKIEKNRDFLLFFRSDSAKIVSGKISGGEHDAAIGDRSEQAGMSG